MFEVNKVQLIGYAGNDPVCSTTVHRLPMCRFSVATTIPFIKPNGDHGTKSIWHNIVMFGDQVNNIIQNIKKGVRCKVLGHIDHVEKTKSDGTVNRYTNIVASSIEICTGLESENSEDDDYDSYAFCVPVKETEKEEPAF
jgi:single stranded DNA-binding protein